MGNVYRTQDRSFNSYHRRGNQSFYIEGAEAGDVLKVTIQKIIPGEWAFTLTDGGFLSDEVGNTLFVRWKLNSEYATSDDLPGIRLPNRSFPGIVTVLPGVEQHAKILAREGELLTAGGTAPLFGLYRNLSYNNIIPCNFRMGNLK